MPNFLQNLANAAGKDLSSLYHGAVNTYRSANQPAPAPRLPQQGQPGFGVARPGVPVMRQPYQAPQPSFVSQFGSKLSQDLHTLTHNPVSNFVGTNAAKPALNFMENGGLIGMHNQGYQQFSRGVSHGLERSAVGTGQALSGLYDMANQRTLTPHTTGLDRGLNTAAQGIDNVARQQHINPVLYKGSQAAGDLAQFAIGSGELKSLAKAAETLPKVGGIARLAGKGAKAFEVPGQKLAALGKDGNIGQRILSKTAGNVLSPKYQAINAVNTAAQVGKDVSHGKGTTKNQIATDLAVGGIGFPLAGAAGSEVGKLALPGLKVAGKASVAGTKNVYKVAQSASSKVSHNGNIDAAQSILNNKHAALAKQLEATPVTDTVKSNNIQQVMDNNRAQHSRLEQQRKSLTAGEKVFSKNIGLSTQAVNPDNLLNETNAIHDQPSVLQTKLDEAKANLNNPNVDSRFGHQQVTKAQTELNNSTAAPATKQLPPPKDVAVVAPQKPASTGTQSGSGVSSKASIAKPVEADRFNTKYGHTLIDTDGSKLTVVGKAWHANALNSDFVKVKDATGNVKTINLRGTQNLDAKPPVKAIPKVVTKKPLPTSKDVAPSKFPTRLMTDKRAEPIYPQLQKLATHDVKHNAPVMAEAAAKVAQNEDAALALAKRGTSTEANATAMTLLNKYLQDGSMEKAGDLLQSVAPRFTRQGQETQILSQFSKLQPAGAVRYAAKEVEKAAGHSANGAKLEDQVVQAHGALKTTAKDVANQLEAELNQGKIGKVGNKTPLTPEEMLAKRIKAPSDKRAPNAPDPVKDMVATLHKVAKQVIPDAEKKLPRDPMELVGQAIKGKSEYTGVYDKAKALVMDKYKDNPAALAELEKYFGTDAKRTYAQSQLNTGVQQGLKGSNLSKIVKEHYTKVDETGAELKQKLIERAGLSEGEAAQLSKDIQTRYDQIVATKKDSVIKQMFGDKPKPEQVQLADRILQYHNLGAMGRDELRPLIAKKLGLATLSPEATQKISGMAAHIQTLKTSSTERHQATADMMRYIAEQKPQSGVDNAVSIWKASLLSGPNTQEGNAFSNGIFSGLKKVSDIPATLADKLMSIKTGQRTKTLTVRGGISGTGDGLGKAKNIMKGHPDYTVGDKYEQHAEINLKNPIMQKVFGMPSNYVFRGMQAADQPFRYAALKNSLYDQAYAIGRNEKLSGSQLKARAEQLVKNPTEQMAITATKESKKAVLDYDTYASRGIQAIHTAIDKFAADGGSPAGAKIANGVVNVIAPFVRVPSAFISRTIDFTPLGIGKEIGHQLFSKTFDQRALSQAIGEGITGTGIIALGMHLSGQGQLSGDYPKTDPKEAQRWKTEGIQPNSIKIGNSWKSLNYFGPVGLLFNVGHKMADAKNESDYKKVAQGIAGLGSGLLGQSFLQGLNGATNAVQDPTKVSSYLNSLASSTVPAWINTAGNATDKLQRQADNVGEAVKNRLPVFRTQNNAKQDVYGNNLPNQAYGINALNGIKPSNDLTKGNSVTSEVSRLHNVNPDDSALQVTPSPIGKSITVDKKQIPINPKQQYDLQKQTGQAIQSNWNKLIQTPEYKAMDDTQKAAALGNIKTLANEDTQRQYVTKNNLGTYSKPESTKASALRDGSSTVAQLASSKSTGGVSSTDTKAYYTSPAAEYKAMQTAYDTKIKNGSYNSDAQRIKAENSLQTAKIGSTYDKSTRDLYGLTKQEAYTYLSGNQDGNAIAQKMLSYGDALAAATGTQNKFRDKYGNVSIRPADKTTGSTRSSAGTATKKYNTSLTNTTKQSITLSKKFTGTKLRVPKLATSGTIKPTRMKQFKQPTAYKSSLNRKRLA